MASMRPRRLLLLVAAAAAAAAAQEDASPVCGSFRNPGAGAARMPVNAYEARTLIHELEAAHKELRGNGSFNAAAEPLSSALALRRQWVGGDRQFARQLHNAGSFFAHDARNVDAADACWREALAVGAAVCPPGDEDLLMFRRAWAYALLAAATTDGDGGRRQAEAVALLAANYEAAVAANASAHAVDRALADYSHAALAAGGGLAAAEPLLQRLVATRRAALGDAHPATLQALHDYGSELAAAGRPLQAEPLLAEALRGRTAIAADTNNSTSIAVEVAVADKLATQRALAAVLSFLGRKRDAAGLYRDELRTRREADEKQGDQKQPSPATLMVACLLAVQEPEEDGVTTADRLRDLQAAYDGLHASAGAAAPDTLECGHWLATALHAAANRNATAAPALAARAAGVYRHVLEGRRHQSNCSSRSSGDDALAHRTAARYAVLLCDHADDLIVVEGTGNRTDLLARARRMFEEADAGLQAIDDHHQHHNSQLQAGLHSGSGGGSVPSSPLHLEVVEEYADALRRGMLARVFHATGDDVALARSLYDTRLVPGSRRVFGPGPHWFTVDVSVRAAQLSLETTRAGELLAWAANASDHLKGPCAWWTRKATHVYTQWLLVQGEAAAAAEAFKAHAARCSRAGAAASATQFGRLLTVELPLAAARNVSFWQAAARAWAAINDTLPEGLAATIARGVAASLLPPLAAAGSELPVGDLVAVGQSADAFGSACGQVGAASLARQLEAHATSGDHDAVSVVLQTAAASCPDTTAFRSFVWHPASALALGMATAAGNGKWGAAVVMANLRLVARQAAAHTSGAIAFGDVVHLQALQRTREAMTTTAGQQRIDEAIAALAAATTPRPAPSLPPQPPADIDALPPVASSTPMPELEVPAAIEPAAIIAAVTAIEPVATPAGNASDQLITETPSMRDGVSQEAAVPLHNASAAADARGDGVAEPPAKPAASEEPQSATSGWSTYALQAFGVGALSTLLAYAVLQCTGVCDRRADAFVDLTPAAEALLAAAATSEQEAPIDGAADGLNAAPAVGNKQRLRMNSLALYAIPATAAVTAPPPPPPPGAIAASTAGADLPAPAVRRVGPASGPPIVASIVPSTPARRSVARPSRPEPAPAASSAAPSRAASTAKKAAAPSSAAASSVSSSTGRKRQSSVGPAAAPAAASSARRAR